MQLVVTKQRLQSNKDVKSFYFGSAKNSYMTILFCRSSCMKKTDCETCIPMSFKKYLGRVLVWVILKLAEVDSKNSRGTLTYSMLIDAVEAWVPTNLGSKNLYPLLEKKCQKGCFSDGKKKHCQNISLWKIS